MIPKEMTFVWLGREMPDYARLNIERFQIMNPDFDVRVIGEEYKLSRWADRAAACNCDCSRSDLYRLDALRKNGGWYMDCDFYTLRSFAPLYEAYCIGNKAFVVEQHHQLNKNLTICNGIMALPSETDNPDIWRLIDAAVEAIDPNENARVKYGPRLITKLQFDFSKYFAVSHWSNFFPCDKRRSIDMASGVHFGNIEMDVMRKFCKDTRGQLPYAIHLWANGKDVEIKERTGDKHAVIYSPLDYKDSNRPRPAIVKGLKALGFEVEIAESYKALKNQPDCIWLWNGLRHEGLIDASLARTDGCTVFHIEHGFYDRRVYSQIDHRSILHWASWAQEWPEVEYDPSRFNAVWKRPLFEFEKIERPNRILVIGQVNGDSQMAESELVSVKQIANVVASNAPNGWRLGFRPHPLGNQHHNDGALKHMERAPGDTLFDAMKQCKFIVTINSNSGVEALAAGIPVLAFGPATYLQAGVARKATVATIRADLQAMCDGWKPDNEKVKQYLYRLADRQWSVSELETGWPQKKLLELAK